MAPRTMYTDSELPNSYDIHQSTGDVLTNIIIHAVIAVEILLTI